MRRGRIRSAWRPVVLVLLAAVPAGLAVLAWRTGRLPGPGWPFRAPAPTVVALPPAAPGPRPAVPEAAPVASPPAPRRPAVEPAERWVIEAGPFASAEAADAVEVELSRLGHATVRFRRQDATRLFVVAVTGLASLDEARRTIQEVGGGTAVEQDGTVEVVVGQHASLGDAVAAARPLRARGLEVRLSEALAPSTVYHVRSAQLPGRADVQALRDALLRLGIRSRVVKAR